MTSTSHPIDIQWTFLIRRAHRKHEFTLRDQLIERYDLQRIDRGLEPIGDWTFPESGLERPLLAW